MEKANSMTRRDDLVALRDAVRAGTADKAMFDATWPYAHNFEHHHALWAYGGSLDAAKALHQAVLPDFGWRVGIGYVCVYKLAGSSSYKLSTGFNNPARAWLLAILEALIAQEGA